MSQHDCVNKTKFDDVVSYAGWAIDLHNPKGIFSGEEGPFYKNISIGLTEIPYRCLYSKNIDNLFVASRCASFTHIALGTTRVESTLAALGQVVGTAASFCVNNNISPRAVGQKHIKELQQTLLKNDLTVPRAVNNDPEDLALTASVEASSTSDFEPLESINDKFIKIHGHLDLNNLKTDKEGRILSPCKPENVINGKLRGTLTESNAWYSNNALPQSVTLTLKEVSFIKQIRVTVDTDLVYPSVAFKKPRFYSKTATDILAEVYSEGRWRSVGKITDNYLRQIRFDFNSINAEKVRVTVLKSTGNDVSKIIEVRIY